MRIAYISFEFPPDTAIGGIATYTENIATLMAARGHHIEVFTASPSGLSLMEQWNERILVHRVYTKDRDNFHNTILPFFSDRHKMISFDLVESPEYSREGFSIKQAFPTLPMVIRFHTPSFWVKLLNQKYTGFSFKERLKRITGIKEYEKDKDKEYLFTLSADGWSVPCASMKDILTAYWNLDPAKINVIPNPFLPTDALLDIPVETSTNRVTFIGRLEVRKGVTQLAAAIPLVLEKKPGVQFRFIGKSNHGPNKKGKMVDYLKEQLSPVIDNIEFIDHIEKEKVPAFLSQTDICVFPSFWELFGYVCIEAMSAARGIVASKEGGMKDMLSDIYGGILIDPESPQQIADGILFLLDNPDQRFVMGIRSRAKSILYYGREVITETERYYEYIGGTLKNNSL